MKRYINIEVFDLIKGVDKIPTVSQLVTIENYKVSSQAQINLEMIAADFLTGILAIGFITNKTTNKDVIDFLNLKSKEQKELFKINLEKLTKVNEDLILSDHLEKGLKALESGFPIRKSNFSFFYKQKQ